MRREAAGNAVRLKGITMTDEPSAEGRVRYDYSDPPGYYRSGGTMIPCKCTPECPDPCKGIECDCEACGEAWNDYLSMPQ